MTSARVRIGKVTHTLGGYWGRDGAVIDCITCLVKIAQGCPTNRATITSNGVTCAMTLVELNANSVRIAIPTHSVSWSPLLNRWFSKTFHFVPTDQCVTSIA